MDRENLSPAEFAEHQLDERIADAQAGLFEDLVQIRKRAGLSISDVAERMGVTTEDIRQFEALQDDPCLSTVRRYAIAVGARIKTRVIEA